MTLEQNSPVISSSASPPAVGGQRPTFATTSSSSSSIRFLTGDVEAVVVEGLRHASMKLDARRYKSTAFATVLLDIIELLRVPSWLNAAIDPQCIKVDKVSGSLTNAVFFVSFPSIPSTRTILLRIYGPCSGSLVSRPRELQTLHILSTEFYIGPQVYGTFENGRLEEHFDAHALTPAEMRDRTVSRWIGARMAELHSVDIDRVEQAPDSEEEGWEIGARKNVISWLPPAREVLALPSVSNFIRKELDLDDFKATWDKYMRWVSAVEAAEGASRRVFAHNDAQCGNLLRLAKLKKDVPKHRQIIVVDFEYASPNPAAFDIGNHFHEWMANYHSSTPHILDLSLYPTLEERCNFYSAYLEHLPASVKPQNSSLQLEIQKLDRQVQVWSPASNAMWAVWGIVQSREDLEGDVKQPEFDYIGCAIDRMQAFRREVKELGL